MLAPSRRGLFSDLTDAQWSFLEPLLLISSKRGRNTETTYATSSMRCSTSRTPGANGVSYRGVGPWTRVWSQFRGGRRTERGAEFSPLCTPRRARRSAERHRDPRWSLSTRTRSRASNGGVTFHNQGGPTVGPTAPNGSSASTSRACHSACESSPLRPPRPVPSNRYSTTSPARRGRTTGARARDGALRSRRPSDSRTNSTTKFAEWDGRAPTQ